MQVVTVPKEVIWATRLLWIDMILHLVFGLIVASTFGIDGISSVIKLLPKIAIWFIVVFGLNYFLLKGKKWSMIIVVLSAILIIVNQPVNSVFDDIHLIHLFLDMMRIAIGVLVVYFLIIQREFFNNTSQNFDRKDYK